MSSAQHQHTNTNIPTPHLGGVETLLVSFATNHDNKTELKPDEPVPVCSASAAAATCCSHGCRGGVPRGERSPLVASIPPSQLSLSLSLSLVWVGESGGGVVALQVNVPVNLDVISFSALLSFPGSFDGLTEEEEK